MPGQRWYQKATVQAALSGGAFIILAAIITGIFMLADDDSATEPGIFSDLKSGGNLTIVYNPQNCTITTGDSSPDDELSSLTRKISLDVVEELIDTRYRWGGTNPRGGFDTSGFVQYLYAKMGIHIPRTTKEQQKYGQHVSLEELIPGDLLFFNVSGGEYPSFVGFYLGEEEFIHAGRPGSGVRKDSLNRQWWANRLVLARRICVPDPSN